MTFTPLQVSTWPTPVYHSTCHGGLEQAKRVLGSGLRAYCSLSLMAPSLAPPILLLILQTLFSEGRSVQSTSSPLHHCTIYFRHSLSTMRGEPVPLSAWSSPFPLVCSFMGAGTLTVLFSAVPARPTTGPGKCRATLDEIMNEILYNCDRENKTTAMLINKGNRKLELNKYFKPSTTSVNSPDLPT